MSFCDIRGPRRALVAALVTAFGLCPFGPAAPQGTYNFYYNWNVGEVYEYSIYILGAITTGEDSRRDIRLKYNDIWKVEAFDESRKVYKVVENSQDVSGADVDLSSFGLPSRGGNVERLIGANGKVESVARYAEQTRYNVLPLVFPNLPLKVGERWRIKYDIRSPLIDRDVPVTLTVVYTFEEVIPDYKRRGQTCARIRIDANYQSADTAQPAGASGQFQGRAFFDIKNKKLVDYQITENRKEWNRPENRSRNTAIQVTCIARE